MFLSCLMKNSKILHIILALFFYVISILSLSYLSISLILFSIFLIIRTIINLINKNTDLLLLNFILIILNTVIMFQLSNLSQSFLFQIKGFIAGVFFMFGNIEVFKLSILIKEESLKSKRMKYGNAINNNSDNQKIIKNKDCNITWEEWKD